MTSGSINDPPLMVRVAVQLMNGLTPRRVYTSGVGPDVAAWDDAAPARPAVMAPVVCNKPRRLMPGRGRFEGLCMFPPLVRTILLPPGRFCDLATRNEDAFT